MLKHAEDPVLMTDEWHREFALLEPEVLFWASERAKKKSIYAPHIAEIRAELKNLYYELLLRLLSWNTLSVVDWQDPEGPKIIRLMRGLIPYARTTKLVEDVNLRTGDIDKVIDKLSNKAITA